MQDKIIERDVRAALRHDQRFSADAHHLILESIVRGGVPIKMGKHSGGLTGWHVPLDKIKRALANVARIRPDLLR